MSKSVSKIKSTLGIAAGALLATSVIASPSAVQVKLHLNDNSIKEISLMKITPSKQAAAQLAKNVQFMLANPRYGEVYQANEPKQDYVGMHGLKVLDQGSHGSCATFASTEGVDTVYPLTGTQAVSQLCNLELGQTLDNPPGTSGGWNGSFGYIVLNQIQDHGFLTKEYQKANGCGGLKQYPVSGGIGKPMSVKDFESNSNKNFTSADWKTLRKYNGNFKPISKQEGAKELALVKQALVNGHDVVFGTVLNQFMGQAGAVGTYNKATDDTWVLTDSSKYVNAGHEMVIDGYDDNACATYNSGKDKQCGLLHLRNSWGAAAGDKGDYYMSYDFFKVMAIESYEMGQGVKK